MIVPQQPTEPLAADYVTIAVCYSQTGDELVAQALMRPFSVIVSDVGLHRPQQLSLAQQNQTVQTLGLDRENKPLRVRIQIRTPRWQAHALHAGGGEDVPELPGEEGISVMDQVPVVATPSIRRYAARR